MRTKTRLLWLAAALLIALALLTAVHGQIPRRPASVDSVSLGLLLLDAEEGVYILAVSDGSAADAAGFLPGDRILAADGAPLSNVSVFNERLLMAPGELLLTVRRDAEEFLLPLRCR